MTSYPRSSWFAILTLFTAAHPAFAAPSASPAAGVDVPKLRLPEGVQPERYVARLSVTPSAATFTGTIEVEISVKSPTGLVWLNATDLTVRRATFTVNGSEGSAQARVVPGGTDFVGFAVDPPLPAGRATLKIEYQGKVSGKDDRGLFHQKEGGRWYAITQFEPIFARRVFPCFDEPSFKTPWQLTIEAPKTDVVLSNTAPTSETPARSGRKAVAFAPTRPLPSYLIALAVGPYQLVDAGKAGEHHIAVRVAAPFGRGLHARYAAKVSAEIVERLERYFGSPFPFEKLDLVAIPLPSQFGAMENPGLVTFSQNLLVAKPEDESISFQREYTEVATHELAHQWFGDLVTTAWWDDIWLNESFASWMEQKIVDEWHPDWHRHTGLVHARAYAMNADGLASARAIRQPILSSDDIYNAFDSITYQKGESVLGMFEHFVGADVFQRGIRIYLKAHADRTATADDFISAISRAADRDVGPAFKTFLDRPGHPVVAAALECAAGRPATLKLSQTRYLPIGSKAPGVSPWQVPVCVAWPKGAGREEKCTLFSEAQATVPLPTLMGCPAWWTANANANGYYRTSYPSEALQHLLGGGKSPLPLHELLALFGDLRALDRAGTISTGDVLSLLAPWTADPRREIVATLEGLVQGLSPHLVPDGLRPRYAKLVQELFGDRARSLGWMPHQGEDEDTRLLRAGVVYLVAVEGEDVSLRAQATALVRRWIGNRGVVDPDVIDGALGAAAVGGDQALFRELSAEARRATERRDRERILRTLGSFRGATFGKAALELTQSQAFDARESSGIFWSQVTHASTRPGAWAFVKSHFDELKRRLPLETLADFPLLAASFCDEPHQADLHQFFATRSPELPGGPRALEQAEEQLALCHAYVQKQKASVEQFLSRTTP
jgi:alanyl aminopeptidase